MPLGYSTVRVNVGALIIDGVDEDDQFDDVPVTGNMVLTPMLDPAKPVQVDDGGVMKIKAISPFDVEIGLTGEISHRNRNYVTVPAPTSLTSNLSMLQWRATFNGLKYGSKAVTVPPIYFWAEPGLQINLAEHINVGPNSTALQLSRGPRGFGIGEVAADGSELVFLSEADGSPEVGRVTLPPQEAVVGADSITNVQLAPGAVGGPELSQDAVTSSKIANDAVARAKLAEAVRTELDGKLSQTVGDARYAPLWQPSTAYLAGQVVTANGVTISRIADGTSRANYDATEQALWTPIVATNAQLTSAVAPKLDRPQAASMYARPNFGTVVLLGDSLVNRTCVLPGETPSGSFPPAYGYSHQGFWAWAQIQMRHRLTLLKEAGVSGQTASQIAARVATDVIPLAPEWCVLRAGTNDVIVATTGQGPAVAASAIATIRSMVLALRAASIRVALFTVPPLGGGGASIERDQAIATINRGILRMAREIPGLVVVNTFAVLADPATGRPRTGSMEADGVHMSPYGSAMEAKVLVAALAPGLPPVDDLLGSNVDDTNLLTNGMFDGSVSGIATGWGIYNQASNATVAGSKVASTDDYPGSWQQVALTSGNVLLTSPHVVMATKGLVEGDRVFAQLEFETDPGATAINHFYLDLRFRTTGAFQLSTRDLMTISTPWPVAYLPRSGVLRTPVVAIPAVSDRVELTLMLDGAGITARVRRAQVIKVPA